MATSNAVTSSAALTELKTDLTRLSNTLHMIYDLMNTDMSQVGQAWQDGKYQEFVDVYKPQTQKCEDISVRYSEWCSRVLDPTIENVIAVENTDVGGGSGSVGGSNSSGIVGGGTATIVGGAGIASGFNMDPSTPKPATKAIPISNGCGSETNPISFGFAKVGQVADADLAQKSKFLRGSFTSFGEEYQSQEASCAQHDEDYYHGVPRKQANIEFFQRSPIMGAAVIAADGMSTDSYNAAQTDRELSEQLQPIWEEENKQCFDSSNHGHYRIVPNDN